MREIVLQTKQLTKCYRNFTALDHADMTVYREDIYGLIGRNGAGKTTMMKLVTGLTEPTNGEYSLFGKILAFIYKQKVLNFFLLSLGFINS